MMQARFLLSVQGMLTPVGLLTYSIVSPGTCRDPPSSTGLLCCVALCSGLSKFRSQPAAVLLGRPSAPGVKARVFPGSSCWRNHSNHLYPLLLWWGKGNGLPLIVAQAFQLRGKFMIILNLIFIIAIHVHNFTSQMDHKTANDKEPCPAPPLPTSAAVPSGISFQMFMDINRLTVMSWFLKCLYILYWSPTVEMRM